MVKHAVVGIGMALLATPVLQSRPAQAPNAQAARATAPVQVAADRFDRSPALRDLPGAAAAEAHAPEEREPRSIRRIQRPRSFGVDPVVQDSPSIPVIPGPEQTFEGVGNVNAVLPPDTVGAVGPNHYVQWVNLSFAVWAKGTSTTPATLVYGPVPGNTLWSGFGGPCETTNDGDVIVRYDHLADRWMFSQLAIPNRFFGLLFGPFYQCIAVSATSDPLGAYYRYQYSFSKLNDYPKFGVWPDAYYMTINQYTAYSLKWAGQGVIAFDRLSMLAGQPASLVYFDLSTVDLNLGGMLPADLDGPAPPPGTPEYFMQLDDDAWGYAPNDELQLWRFHVDWANPTQSTFTGPVLLPTAPFDSDLCGYARNCITQPGTSAKLDALGDRLMYRLQYRNFGDHDSLVVNHSVDVDGTDHAGIRWYEVRNPGSAPMIYQQGTYAPDGDNRWMGSAAMDSAGNLALGFSVSSTTTYPSIRYTGRLAGDPLGVMTQGEADLMVGSGSQLHDSGRWGDYSLLGVDPSDDCTFWYTQEYYAATSESGWQTRVGSFRLPNCTSSTPPPTLPAVSVMASVPQATEAGLVAGEFTVSRSGATDDPLDVSYTIGGTATPDADYVALPGSVTIPAGQSSVTIAVVPLDDPDTEPDETVVLSVNSNAAYILGSGPATVTVVSDDLPPDLIVSSLTAPLDGGAGEKITASDTTKNQGSGPSPASVTGFYLSKDLHVDASDVRLGSRDVPALAVGASSTVSTELTIPADTATGVYYLLGVADEPNLITESQENNNTAFRLVRVGPDLVIASVAAPTAAGAGDTIAVSETTTNQGAGAADASTTAYYLSANLALDEGDAFLGSRSVPALAPGATSTATVNLKIPANTATGLYRVIAMADSGLAVAETSETNNTRPSLGINVGPDLIVSSVTVPSLAGAGAPITIGNVIANQGAGDATASSAAFYLSTNLGLDASDVLLGTRAVPSLVSGASSAASTTLTLPTGIPSGNYYVIVQADPDNKVVESSETNNLRTSSIVRIGPNLVVSALSATPTNALAGTIVVIADTTSNIGGGAADATTTTLYLSVDLVLDPSDVLVGSRAVPSLGVGASNSGSVSIVVAEGTAPGFYHIIAEADGGHVVDETSETNNTRLATLQVLAP